MRMAIAAAALLSLAAPATARALGPLRLGLEVYGGLDRYDAAGLESGLDRLGDTDLEDSARHLGLLALLGLGGLELGALVEQGRPGDDARTTTVGALLGFGIGSTLRLDLLGEVGGRRYGDFLRDPEVVTRSEDEVWLAYAGLRPGVSWRSAGPIAVVVGVWGFARWDLNRENVRVGVTPSEGGPPVDTDYELGGSSFGASLRLGLEF